MAFEVSDVVNRETEIWQLLKQMPKVELHRHLEGSIRPETLIAIAQEHNIPLPTYDIAALRPYVQMTGEDQPTHSHFLSKFSVLRQFFISEEVIRRVTHEAVMDAAADNIRYMELRFTPYALAKVMDFPLDEVVQWVIEAVNEATTQTKKGIIVNLIIAMNRHESVEIGEAMMQVAINFMGRGVVGIDLCGNEVGHPATPFVDIFHKGREAGLGITIHAGEWDGSHNVIEAIERIPLTRIGHGVRAVEDIRALRLAREHDVVFEVCPTSNLQTGVAPNLSQHPLIDLHYLKARITFNTDDPAIHNTTLTDELALVVQGLGFSLEYVKTCIMNSIEASFLPDEARQVLAAEMQRELNLFTLQEES